jgi:hypothetical protein
VLARGDLPRWFIIVRRDRPGLHEHLRESYDGDARVEVILDRRPAPTMPIEVDMRRAERRMGDRRTATRGDRRQAPRRQLLAPSQHAFWVTEGFFMVRRTPETPRL